MNQQEAALVRVAKIASVVLSCFLLVLGIILVVWSDELAPTLRYLFGSAAILAGAVKIFGYFTNDLYRIAFQFDLTAGSLVVIFGVFLLALPETVEPYLSTAVAVYVLLDGLFRVQTAVDAQRFGMPYWYLVLVGALLLVGGAVAMFLFADVHRIIWMGAVLMADSAMNAFVTIYTVRVRVRKQEQIRAMFREE